MRPLTDTETKTLFDKLANYTGRSLSNLLTPTPTATTKSTTKSTGTIENYHVFRIHNTRVYYLPLHLANLATSISRTALLSLGTCIGKFTRTGKFRLHITALDVIAPHARYKVWVKGNGEMPFLYGGHVVKAHVGRWSEDVPEHAGVVVLGMGDVPLVSFFVLGSAEAVRSYADVVLQGFGVTARSTAEARRLDPTGIVVFRQADAGEYLRDEDTLFAT